jgi:hypothetical protein
MLLLCKIVKHFFYIPPILVVKWSTISLTEAFATDAYVHTHTHLRSTYRSIYIVNHINFNIIFQNNSRHQNITNFSVK